MREVVTVAYRVAEASGPILGSEAALLTALREAAAARPPIPKSCPGCQKMNGARCGHHAGGSTSPRPTTSVGHALSGPVCEPLRTDQAPASGDHLRTHPLP